MNGHLLFCQASTPFFGKLTFSQSLHSRGAVNHRKCLTFLCPPLIRLGGWLLLGHWALDAGDENLGRSPGKRVLAVVHLSVLPFFLPPGYASRLCAHSTACRCGSAAKFLPVESQHVCQPQGRTCSPWVPLHHSRHCTADNIAVQAGRLRPCRQQCPGVAEQ